MTCLCYYDEGECPVCGPRPAERRLHYRASAECGYCGADRDDHDRLSREWEACAAKAAWFRVQGSALEPALAV